jgi:tetratricopeptide (TPR) repeat protein
MMPRNQLLEWLLARNMPGWSTIRHRQSKNMLFRQIAYESLQNRDSVIAISEKAAALYQKYGYRQESAISIGNAVHDLVLSGQYRKAGRYINYYKAHSGRFDAKGNIIHDYVNFYYTLGLYYMGIGKPDSAEYYLHKELREGKDYNNQISGNYGLAKLYMQTGRQALAAKYALRAYDMKRLGIRAANSRPPAEHSVSIRLQPQPEYSEAEDR